MSHELEVVNGVASFFTNKVPAWHGLGQVVEGAQTWEEAVKLAHMDWEVIKRKLQDPVSGEEVDIYGMFRSDNNAFLGAVGERYTPVQNQFIFKFMDGVLGEGGAHYETAGVLGKGERVFVSANAETEYDIHGSGDKHKCYLVGHASHDGSSSVRFVMSDTRPVCKNTLNIVINTTKGTGATVRHTVNAETRIMQSANLIIKARDRFKSTMEMLEAIAERKVDNKIVAKTVAQLFGITDETKEVPTRTMNAMEKVKELFEYNDDNIFPEFRGSAYNLFNSITEYTDHYKEVRMTDKRGQQTIEQVRADSAMFGLGADFKAKALDIIIENTKNCQKRDLHRAYSAPAPKEGESVLDAVLGQYN